MTGLVEIVAYQARWPAEFRAAVQPLRSALAGLALRIDHIGSTAVEALPAKDIIDIQVTVAALADEIGTRLAAAGYAAPPGVWQDFPPPGGGWTAADCRKLFVHQPAGQRRQNIHIRVAGRANQRFALLFRDYLRANPDAASAYAAQKKLLAAHLADHALYPEVKQPTVHLIGIAAETWAATCGWTLPPPDAADPDA